MPDTNTGWLESIKNIAEIAALVIGGAWAVYNFNLKDKPGLALREKASSKLTWERLKQDPYVHAEFYVTLDNIGTSPFEITKIKLYVWSFNEESLDTNKDIKYYNFSKIRDKGTLILNDSVDNKTPGKWLPNTPFIGPYAQGTSWSENLEILLKPYPKRRIAFYIEFYQGDKYELLDWTYQWDYIGGIKKDDAKND